MKITDKSVDFLVSQIFSGYTAGITTSFDCNNKKSTSWTNFGVKNHKGYTEEICP